MLSNFRYLKAEGSDVLQPLDGPILDSELKNFEEILQKNRKKLFDEHFIDGKKRPEVSHHPLYVTVEQRVVAEDINNATKDEILRRIADKLEQVSDEDVRGPLSIKLQLFKAQPNKAKKDTPIVNQECVVYHLKCKLCDADYIDNTYQLRNQRIEENKESAIKRRSRE